MSKHPISKHKLENEMDKIQAHEHYLGPNSNIDIEDFSKGGKLVDPSRFDLIKAQSVFIGRDY